MAKRDEWKIIPIEPDNAGTEFGTGNPEDDAVLWEIAKHSPLDQPRHWIHFLPCRDKASATAAGAAVAEGSWSVKVTSSRWGRKWCVIAEQHDVVTSPEKVREARLFFEDIASRIQGVSYDGWQASA
ncbi:MAG TPA: ribonuclease E inhibitor RraB [Streptosporangiaceae bacterium]|nr:ribonuclease E inhibitor RraB [Streptosporangiaceae bacterium]